MKGCLIAIVAVLAILMIIITAGLVYFFAFEKEVPAGLINLIKEEIAGVGSTTFNVDYKLVNEFGDVADVVTNTIYDASGEITYYEKTEMTRSGKDDTLVIEVKYYDKDGNLAEHIKLYIEDGKYKYIFNEEVLELDEEDWKNCAPVLFASCMPFEEQTDGQYKLEGGEYLENFSRMTQKGMDVTAYAYNGDDEYVLAFNLRSTAMSSYKMTLYTKDGETVVQKQVLDFALDLDLSKFAK